MIRECRYLVLKHTDIEASLTQEELNILKILEEKITRYRINRNAGHLECVVVEEDWPEYETVWKMIEERVDTDA